MYSDPVMSSNDLMVFDFGTLQLGNILQDFVCMAMMSMKPEDSDKNMKKFISTYYDSFSHVCKLMSQEPLWKTKKEFEDLVMGPGLYTALVWTYVRLPFLVVNYPRFAESTRWVLELCVKHCPQFLE